MNTFFYCVRQGFSNLRKNLLFTIASIATISACIFLFCLFYSVITNVKSMVYQAETTVGITVFFNKDVTSEEKNALREELTSRGDIRQINYISADEAWASFQEEYFGDEAAELSEAFADDNPLADSDSFEIFPVNIEDQETIAGYLQTLPAVREVRYANTVVSILENFNIVISILSAVIIGVLFAVSVFLISNTINVGAILRRRENEIMKLIGATNFMIRAPFVIEGLIIGIIGSVIPVAAIYVLYQKAVLFLEQKLVAISRGAADIFTPVPFQQIFPVLIVSALALGAGMGFVVSFVTIRKHLKV